MMLTKRESGKTTGPTKVGLLAPTLRKKWRPAAIANPTLAYCGIVAHIAGELGRYTTLL